MDTDFQDIQEAVHIWLQPKTIFSDGIKKSVDQHNSVWRMGKLCQKMTLHLCLFAFSRFHKKVQTNCIYLFHYPHIFCQTGVSQTRKYHTKRTTLYFQSKLYTVKSLFIISLEDSAFERQTEEILKYTILNTDTIDFCSLKLNLKQEKP